MSCEVGELFHAESVHTPSARATMLVTVFNKERGLMNWKAANEQQQEARWRIFLMFVVMAILIIRTGLAPRQLRELLTVFPPAPVLKPRSLSGEESELFSRSRPSPSSDGQHQAIIVALLLAEVAGQVYILSAREVWELMNRPLSRPARAQSSNVANASEPRAQRLDTS
jgi:hypothetical protein